MDERKPCHSSSWKKMVISKSNEELISEINSANGEELKMNTNNFSISEHLEQPDPNIKIKIEIEDVECELQETEDYSINLQDPLLKEIMVRKLSPDQKDSSPKHESNEARARRLAKMSAYAAHRLANESPEQRAMRLKRMSEYATKRLAQETSEQRARRLARMSAYSARRIANETSEQRQVRLAKMSAYAARRNAMKKKANTTLLVQDMDTNITQQCDTKLLDGLNERL